MDEIEEAVIWLRKNLQHTQDMGFEYIAYMPRVVAEKLIELIDMEVE